MIRTETFEGGFEIRIEDKDEGHWEVTVLCCDERITQVPVYGLLNARTVGLAIIGAYLKGTIAFGRDQLQKWQDEDDDDDEDM